MQREKIEQIRRISLMFFCVLTGLYVLAWLLWKNDLVTNISQVLAENLAVPLYIVGAVVIMSSSAHNIDTQDPEKKPMLIAIWILTIAVFFGLMLLDLFSRA